MNLQQKICGACGEAFGCGALVDGCWCTDIALPPAVSDDLKSEYEDCLCPACLRALAAADVKS